MYAVVGVMGVMLDVLNLDSVIKLFMSFSFRVLNAPGHGAEAYTCN